MPAPAADARRRRPRRDGDTTRLLAGQPIACGSLCTALDELAAQDAGATLTFDHANSPDGPLHLLAVDP